MEAAEKAVILEVTREHHKDVQKYTLTDVKEVSTGRDKEPTARSNEDKAVGAYGNVIDLEWNGTQVAGKILHAVFFASGTEPGGVRKVLTKFFEEIKLLSKMNHSNIVQFLGMYYRQDSLLPVLVMEKMECNLNQFLTARKKGSLSDDRVLGILLDVSKGLVYLHEEVKVAHRDLSSNNILLTTDLTAKIADLGSARVLDRPGGWGTETKLTVAPGTTDFMPPEALEDPPKYTVSVDVFSFGCVIIHVCTHKWPTPIGKTAQGKIISEFKRRQKYISEINHSCLLPLLKQCLEEVNTKRLTSRNIMLSLQTEIEGNASSVDYTIVLSGITGMGKSTAGNFFLDKDCFPTKRGFISCTEECSVCASTIVCGKRIKIIDTPGFFDGLPPTDGNFKELSRVLAFVKDGIHAVALVIRYGHFTKACEEAIQQLQLLTGVLPFVFILITHAKKQGVTTTATAECIEQFLTSSRCAPGFRTLIELVENRVIMLEAVDHVAENYHQQKCNELLMMVEKIYKRNGNKVYTNSMLQYASQVYEIVKGQPKEEIQAKMKSLESNLQKMKQLKQQINNTTNDKAAVEKISKEITVLQKKSEDLAKELEQISGEKYLVDSVGTFSSATVVGGIAGGAIGMLLGPTGAGMGATIGAVVARAIRDNCNQQ